MHVDIVNTLHYLVIKKAKVHVFTPMKQNINFCIRGLQLKYRDSTNEFYVMANENDPDKFLGVYFKPSNVKSISGDNNVYDILLVDSIDKKA